MYFILNIQIRNHLQYRKLTSEPQGRKFLNDNFYRNNNQDDGFNNLASDLRKNTNGKVFFLGDKSVSQIKA